MNPPAPGPLASPSAEDRSRAGFRSRFRFPVRLAFPVLSCAFALGAAFLPGAFLAGCAPGTSTDAGNPELVIGFRKGGKPVDFEGAVHVYATDSNPAFYAPSPSGDRSSRDVNVLVEVVGCGREGGLYGLYGNSHSWEPAGPVKRISRCFLDEAAGYRAALPLLPVHQYGKYSSQISAQAGAKGLALDRPFNLIFDQGDSINALVEGIAIDALRTGYLAADGKPFDTLWVDLERGVGITGSIDTAGLPDRPLILFMPGSPLSTPVQGNRFHLPDAPRRKFEVRMVTRSGLIYAFREPLDGTRSDAFYADSVLDLAPGARLDSVALPEIYPFPAAPVASPAGPRNFTDSLLVTLTAEPGVALYYTTDSEEEPGLHSTRYTRPVRLKGTTTLKAVAYRQGQNLSPVSANTYIQVPLPPKASPAGQAFRDSIVVALATPARNGVIRYTVDGTEPHDSSLAYVRPLVFRTTTTLKAVTWVEGMFLSQRVEERYVLVADSLGQP